MAQQRGSSGDEPVKERHNGIYVSRFAALSVLLFNAFLLVACISMLLLLRESSTGVEVHRVLRQLGAVAQTAPNLNAVGEATTRAKRFTPGPTESPMSASTARMMPYNRSEIMNRLRVPLDIRPFHYDIHWRPDIYHPSPSQFTLNGTAKLYLRCDFPSDTITINYRRLVFDTFSYTIMNLSNHEMIPINHVCADRVNEVYTIIMDRRLAMGNEVVLTMMYTASIQEGPMAEMPANTGVFRTEYRMGNETRYALFTHMRTTDARSTFPCVDDPSAKATFTISVDRQTHMRTMSNTPLNYTAPDEGRNSMWVTDIFQTTMNMSTYLVAFSVSEYMNVTTNTGGNNPVQIGLWSEEEYVDEGYLNFSASIVPRLVDFYAEFFNYSYNWPKLDLASIPGKNFGAMENWGLLFFQSNYLLFDNNRSDSEDRIFLFGYVSNMVLHNWLGNTVTIRWWDDAWFTEGLDIYLQYMGIQRQQPRWDTDQIFIYESFYEESMWVEDSGMALPLMVYNNNLTTFMDLNNQFNYMTFNKAACLMRMLARLVVGEEVFRTALRNFIRRYQYSNADNNEFFREMIMEYNRTREVLFNRSGEFMYNRSSGEGITIRPGEVIMMNRTGEVMMNRTGEVMMNRPGEVMEFNVTEVMATWIMQDGYPLVMVSRGSNDASNRLNFTQSMYLFRINLTMEEFSRNLTMEELSRNLTMEELRRNLTMEELRRNLAMEELRNSPYGHLWEIPVVYTTSYEPMRPSRVWMHKEREITVRLNQSLTAMDWVLVNYDLNGYYRVNYDEDNWMALANQLSTNLSKIPISNRAQLIEDSFTLSMSGHLSQMVGLRLVKYLSNETGYLPWKLFHDKFVLLLARFSNNPDLYGRLQMFSSYLLGPNYYRLGWNATANEDITTIFLRRLTLDMLCSAGAGSCVNEALSRFQMLKQNGFNDFNSVTPDQRQIVYCVAAGNGSYDDWRMLLMRYRETMESFTSESTKLAVALTCTWNFTTIDSLIQMIQNRDRMISPRDYDTILSSIALSPQGYNASWDHLMKYGERAVGRMAILSSLASVISTREEQRMLESYLMVNGTGMEEARTLEMLRRTVMQNVVWRERNQQNISDFLTSVNIPLMPFSR